MKGRLELNGRFVTAAVSYQLQSRRRYYRNNRSPPSKLVGDFFVKWFRLSRKIGFKKVVFLVWVVVAAIVVVTFLNFGVGFAMVVVTLLFIAVGCLKTLQANALSNACARKKATK